MGNQRAAARYFVRDDDVGPLTPELASFVGAFVARRIPVSYQIIPARLTIECAEFLLTVQRAHPTLIEFGQHGLNHEMQLGRRMVAREFGPERSYQQQSDDIKFGLEILRTRLGPTTPIKVFTPPQHKFNADTIRAVAAAGHSTFSAACYPTAHHQLAYGLGRRLGLSSVGYQGISYHGVRRPEADMVELSISIPADNGRRRRLSALQTPAALHRATHSSGYVGLMFHHAVYGDEKERAELEAIADQLVAWEGGEFRLLGALAAVVR
ncbi:MAG TPA: DUF2334 domain-containing protein [Caulobacteraceae bacterium]|jgi:hypothetical protein|nr:DUF2334 domain-containing protein [Caulobacteraceae bacterium]